MREAELVVIGAGQAGLGAARTAARLGIETVLVDENPIDPANIRRNIPYWYGSRAAARAARRADPFAWLTAHPELTSAAEEGVELMLGTSAWGLFPDARAGHAVGLFDGSGTSLVRSQAVILATGATDLHLPFPGWTLGGVFGARGALHLFELSGYLEAQRMLVLGTGALARQVVRRSLAAGVEVVGLVNVSAAAPRLEPLDAPVWHGYTVREAVGAADVERIVLTPVDTDGNQVTLEVDAVCVAIGQQPSVELAYVAGCQLGYNAAVSGHCVAHDELGRASRAGIFVANGDLDGTAVARAAAGWVRGGDRRWPEVSVRSVLSASAYATAWHRVADELASDDVLVCRCEEVTRGAVLAAMREGCGADPDEVKRVTRAGMGLCQGRGCRPIVAGILANAAGKSFGEMPVSSYRPPVRPVPLAALAMEESVPPPEFQPFAEAEMRLAAEARAGRLAPLALMRFRRSAEEAAFRCQRDNLSPDEVDAFARELEEVSRKDTP